MAINTSNNNNYTSDVYINLTNEELSERAKQAFLNSDFDEAGKIGDILKARKEKDDTMPLVYDSDQLAKRYEALMEKINQKNWKKHVLSQKQRTEELKKFFEEDIKNYSAGITKSAEELTRAKDKQIEDLQKRLSETMTTLPEAREYFSPKRRHLVSVHTEFEKSKKDSQNYPKNFMIYAMGLSNSSLFTWWQGISRGFIKKTWKRQRENIKEWLATFDEKVKITDKDPAWTKALKLDLQEKMQDAKKAYIEQEKENIWLAA